MKKQYNVIIPENIFPKPNQREISAAFLLARHFKTDVVFLARSNHKTPDFLINNQTWELKTPTGTGKYNIQHTLRAASRQSDNIIIDARFSKRHINKIKRELKYQFDLSKTITRLILIDKAKNIIELFR